MPLGPWFWGVAVGYVAGRALPGPKATWGALAQAGGTIFLASPLGRATILFAARPLPSIFWGGARVAPSAYRASFARSFPTGTRAALALRGTTTAAVLANPITWGVVAAVAATATDVNLQAKHGAGVWGGEVGGVAPSKHLEGGKPWWEA